jgi:DNA-binding NarL/FixJ family response regulator
MFGIEHGRGAGAKRVEGAVGCRVLIVEDDAIQAEGLEDLLRRRGHEICGHARSGEAALYLARTRRPRVVLMDVRLAGSQDGVDAANLIRAAQWCGVVFLTAHTDGRTRERMAALAPAAILIKPAGADEIAAAVEQAATLC